MEAVNCDELVRLIGESEDSEYVVYLRNLQRDALRLDWLDKTGRTEGHGFCDVGYGDYRFYVNNIEKFPSARETIDEAMQRESDSPQSRKAP